MANTHPSSSPFLNSPVYILPSGHFNTPLKKIKIKINPDHFTYQYQYLKCSIEVCVPPAVGLASQPAAFVRRLFQPAVLVKSIGGGPGDRRLQLLPRPRADGRRVLSRSIQNLIHRLVDGPKPLGLGKNTHSVIKPSITNLFGHLGAVKTNSIVTF